jgi:ferredoxin
MPADAAIPSDTDRLGDRLMRRSGYRLIVDPIACDGAGVCAELLPEMISADPWGFPIIDGDEIPRGLLDLARRTASSCPRLALTLVRNER